MTGWAPADLPGPLAVLSELDLRALWDRGSLCEHARGDVLVRQGARTSDVHVLVSGRFRVVVSTRSGRTVLLAVRGPGHLVGELAAIDGTPRTATVSALERARSLQIPTAVFREFARHRPELTWSLLEATVRRLRESDQRFVGAAAEVTVTRVARRLLEVAAEHGRLVPDGIRLDLPLSQEELASWVGSSREGVSHALGQLRRDGLITTARMAITIRDVDGLRTIAMGA